MSQALPVAVVIGQTSFDVDKLARVVNPALGRNPAAAVDLIRRPLGDTERALLTLASALNLPIDAVPPTVAPLANVVVLIVAPSHDADDYLNALSPLSTFVVPTVNPSVMLLIAGGSLATWRGVLDNDSLEFVAGVFKGAQLW